MDCDDLVAGPSHSLPQGVAPARHSEEASSHLFGLSRRAHWISGPLTALFGLKKTKTSQSDVYMWIILL